MSVNDDLIHVPALPVVVLGRFDLPALVLGHYVALKVRARGFYAMAELQSPDAFICNAFNVPEFRLAVCGALDSSVLDSFFGKSVKTFPYRAHPLHTSIYRRTMNVARRLWAQHILDHVEEALSC